LRQELTKALQPLLGDIEPPAAGAEVEAMSLTMDEHRRAAACSRGHRGSSLFPWWSQSRKPAKSVF
jgi:hypothetical protein